MPDILSTANWETNDAPTGTVYHPTATQPFTKGARRDCISCRHELTLDTIRLVVLKEFIGLMSRCDNESSHETSYRHCRNPNGGKETCEEDCILFEEGPTFLLAIGPREALLSRPLQSLSWYR